MFVDGACGSALHPSLPDGRVAFAVKDRDDFNAIRMGPVIHAIGETGCYRFANVCEDDGGHLGMDGDSIEDFLNLGSSRRTIGRLIVSLGREREPSRLPRA